MSTGTRYPDGGYSNGGYPDYGYPDYGQPTYGYGSTPPPPAPRRNRRLVGAIVAGGAATAIVAGGIGGAVGYGAARLSAPQPMTTVSAGLNVATSADSVSAPADGSIAAIAAALQPSVVQLNVSGADGSGTGSGFIVRQDGYILTNNHVAGAAGNGGAITVVFNDGTKADATLVGTNVGYDLAVVKVDRTGLPAVTLGSSSALKVGDSAIAIGSPLGLQGTVTSGIISALNRPVTTGSSSGTGDSSYISAIQTDAAINPGNSGGPLVNGLGQVVGVNSAIATMGSGGQSGSIGLGFAIPIDTASRIAEEIITTGTSTTPIVGVQIDMAYAGEGARLSKVDAGGPAASAGLQAGDVVTKVDGQVVSDSTELIVAIRAHAPGEHLTITAERNGASEDYDVVLGSK